MRYFEVLLPVLLVVIADKVHLKGSYRAEFKLRRSELFEERSKKSPLKSASLSTRRLSAYAFFPRSLDEVTLTITRQIAHVHTKKPPVSLTSVGARDVRHGNTRHTTRTACFFLLHTLPQTELIKEGRSKWRL